MKHIPLLNTGTLSSQKQELFNWLGPEEIEGLWYTYFLCCAHVLKVLFLSRLYTETVFDTLKISTHIKYQTVSLSLLN